MMDSTEERAGRMQAAAGGVAKEEKAPAIGREPGGEERGFGESRADYLVSCDGEERSTRRRGWPRRVRIPIALALAVLGPALWFVARPGLGIFYNMTTSLPRGFYRQVDAPASRGDVVMSCLPEEAALRGLARRYLVPGTCPYGEAPVAKVVAAMAGDTVRVTEAGVWVGGRLLPRSAPKESDNGGRPLPDVRGVHVVRAGEVWLYTGYSQNSYDSRYYGATPDSLVLGRAVPLLIWPWEAPYDPKGDITPGGASDSERAPENAARRAATALVDANDGAAGSRRSSSGIVE